MLGDVRKKQGQSCRQRFKRTDGKPFRRTRRHIQIRRLEIVGNIRDMPLEENILPIPILFPQARQLGTVAQNHKEKVIPVYLGKGIYDKRLVLPRTYLPRENQHLAVNRDIQGLPLFNLFGFSRNLVTVRVYPVADKVNIDGMTFLVLHRNYQ